MRERQKGRDEHQLKERLERAKYKPFWFGQVKQPPYALYSNPAKPSSKPLSNATKPANEQEEKRRRRKWPSERRQKERPSQPTLKG